MRDSVKSGALTEVTFFVLLSLYQPNHGYAMMQFIETQTNGRLTIGAGSLYGAINHLLKKKWIEPADDGSAHKKDYRITELGKEIVDLEIRRLNELITVAQQIVGGGEK